MRTGRTVNRLMRSKLMLTLVPPLRTQAVIRVTAQIDASVGQAVAAAPLQRPEAYEAA